jgi:Subtilase family
MRRLIEFTLIALCGLVVVGGATAQRRILAASDGPHLARQGQAMQFLTALPPDGIVTKPMRWAREQPPVRRPAGARYADGRAVVGVEPGTESVDLGSGVSIVSFDPRLHAAEVAGSPAALSGLESRVSLHGPLRYVEPVSVQVEQHERSDPATYTIDPSTGAPYEWAFTHVGLDRALNLTHGDSQILVGIVDTGWSQIPEIQSKVAESWFYTSEGTDAFDTEGHGTFVASIISAENDDGYGLAGYCGACRIIPFRVVNLTSFEVAGAIRKLVDEHVRIINLSLAGGPSFIELDAVNYAISKNVLLVASSGNDGAAQVSYPAAWLMGDDGALGWGLAVGASGPDDQRVSFSNWGSRLSLVAPGAGSSCADAIFGAIPAAASGFGSPDDCNRVVDLGNGSRYAYASGTSFSAPEVAGVAALVMAVRPELTNAQVANIIEQTATRPGPGWQPDIGWGVLNAAAALELATGRSGSDSLRLGRVQVEGTRRAGSVGVAAAGLSWSDGTPVASGAADCDVEIAGRTIEASATLADGTARCTWRVPSGLGGKAGNGSLSATDDEGNHTSGEFAFRVAAGPKAAKRHK